MEQTVASENLEMTSSLVRNDITLLALVVPKMDSTINQINHYPFLLCCYIIDSYDTNWHPILLYHNLFYFVLNYVPIQYENI